METKYRIWMEELDDLEEGYCCGHSLWSNAPMARTKSRLMADSYDMYNAVKVSQRYKKKGYKCKVVPEVSPEDILRILY